MELIPKHLVVGLFAVEEPSPGSTAATEEKINRIWSEVAPRQGYRLLNLAPDRSGAEFSTSETHGLTIQLPLLQVRSDIGVTADRAADEAAATLKTVAKHLGLTQFYNLGIKHVYHATVPTNDAGGFVLRTLLRKEETEIGPLERGGETFWAGLKYGAVAPDGSFYVLVVEPFLSDEKFLYVDLDSNIPGPVELESIKEHAGEAQRYLAGPVKEYLERADTST